MGFKLPYLSICHCLAGLLKKPFCRIDSVGVAGNDIIRYKRGGANPKVTFNFDV